MNHAQIVTLRPFYVVRCVICVVATLIVGGACHAQAVLQQPQGANPWEQELNKYPGLIPEAGQLIVKLQNNVHLPAARSESYLLPLLPESTVFYAAFPNYGDAAQQTLKTFRAELQESAVLRDWWLHGEVAAAGPKLEDFLEKFAQFQGYLGDEIVLAGATDGREPSLLVIAEVRKPGLKGFLEQVIAQVAGNSKPGVRVLDPQQLAKLEDKGRGQEFMVLVRPDYVVGAADLKTLRSLNARLDQHSQGLASTAFGKRVVQEYSGGVVVLAAADLQSMLSLLPPVARGEQTPLYQSGFGDVQYLVWDRKSVGAESLSQSELTFIAPRHGAAAWLAKPAPLSTLDFVSPKPMMALTVSLIKPTKIFEDAKVLTSSTNPNAFTSLEQFEKILKLSLKDDLLSYLTGELTLELDEINPPKPKWKVILKVNDTAHLQQTLNTLLATTHFETQHDEKDGVAYNTVTIPSGATTTEIGYAFADGHLIVGSGREVVADAVELHRTGGSLGKSKALVAALPPGRTLEASALLYQDPIAMSMLQMRRFAPQMSQLAGQGSPSVVGVYAEDTAIREASKSAALDAGVALVVAAIAIPNLLRSRMAANEASAVGSIRTVNVAQVTYFSTYPKRGYAANLAALGSGPGGSPASEEHADFIDSLLGDESCTGDAWCTKSGFKFRVTSKCKLKVCSEYLVVAMPVNNNAGARSFCSTPDGVIRWRMNELSTVPDNAAECRKWQALN